MGENDVDNDIDQLELSDEQKALFKQLVRVSSSLNFRKWVRKMIWVLVGILVLNLSVAGYTIYMTRQSCLRDNRLRSAYVTQWQPLLDAAKKKDDPDSRNIVIRFEIGLSGFAQHSCPIGG